jgi:citronellol/citronellal dehydrogenase
MGRLQEKVAIVTGTSRGIGKTIAQLFASEGARVVCAARTMHEGEHKLEGSLETTISEIRASGGEASGVTCDVSSQEDCERLVTKARELYGPCDILVNNAVLAYFIAVKDYPVSRWLRSFAVNVHGSFILSQLVLQDMVPRRSGAIVNVSSSDAIGPGRGPYNTSSSFRGTTCYGATKAAIERMTQGLAREVYGYGISVSCIAPSEPVITPGTLLHHRVSGPKALNCEPTDYTAQATLLLASEPIDKVAGLVTYSQVLLKQYGLLKEEGRGVGFDRKGTGYSMI